MIEAPLPWNEELRLLDLKSYDLLDTPEEQEFNDIVELAAQICDCPLSTISLIDKNRQWFKARKGIVECETTRGISFCAHALLQENLLIVEDILEDERFFDNPLVTNLHLRFYAGAPIMSPTGFMLGTLCVIDHKPKKISGKQESALRRLSRLVSVMLEKKLKNRILERHARRERREKDFHKEASLAKAQFLSTMSHEIRTPLNGIIGFTNLLMDKPREDQKEYLRLLKFSAKNLSALINDILDFSKIEAGKVELENFAFHLPNLLHNIYSTMLLKAEEKKLRLILQMDPSLPEHVSGDATRLSQILTNLLSNALKFTNKGEVLLSASLQNYDEQYITIRFTVKDSGIGIRKDQHQRIFENFTQASEDTTRKYGGTGLGLTIVKKLLELQGSTIHLDSREGVGSLFYFDLRLNKTHELSKIHLPEQQVFDKKMPEGLNILLAEDNLVNVLLMSKLLEQWQVAFDVAENGEKVLELIKLKDYDLVIMDIQMPIMDGYEATATIRKMKEEKYKRLPILALSASTTLEEKEKVYQCGMNDFLGKPFQPEDLYNKLKLHVFSKTENELH